VAAAIAKRRERMFYVNAEALSGIAAYMATTRRAAISRAQNRGAYDRLRGKLIVIKISQGRQLRLFWEDPCGNRSDAAVGALMLTTVVTCSSKGTAGSNRCSSG